MDEFKLNGDLVDRGSAQLVGSKEQKQIVASLATSYRTAAARQMSLGLNSRSGVVTLEGVVREGLAIYRFVCKGILTDLRSSEQVTATFKSSSSPEEWVEM